MTIFIRDQQIGFLQESWIDAAWDEWLSVDSGPLGYDMRDDIALAYIGH